MTKEKLDVITGFIIKIMRDGWSYVYDEDKNYELLEIVASLHNELYKEVTGEYYDYMFHWANKCGMWVEDNLFKYEEEKEDEI